MVGGVTLLILLAVGSVLLITLTSATRNTFELLADQTDNTLDILESRIDRQLGPVVNAAGEFARQFADGRLNLDASRTNTFHAFSGALSSNSQMTAILFIRADGNSITVTRQEGYPLEVRPTQQILERQKFALQTASDQRDPFWAPPLWVPTIRQAILAHIAPVWRGDELHGVVITSLTLAGVSEFLQKLRSENELNAFILYDHDKVLAHSRLNEERYETPSTPDGTPLPSIDGFPEPAFHMLRGGGDRALTLLEFAGNIHDARVDADHVMLTRDTPEYGQEIWTLGVILGRDIVGRELVRLRNTAVVGLAIFLLALVIGIWFARHLNRQIGGLIRSASALTRLEVANAPEVPDSRITELSDAAQAFNRMISALRLFETYVPKQLVLGLMQRGETIETSEERVLTIMFTDIRGFSTRAEHMGAGEIADLLNTHFEMLGSAIEAEGGTVDKYIGDAIMAFWGAPEQVPDHAARALRAAAEIQRRVRADNDARRAQGDEPLRIRVGIHTGRVIVGNITSKNRVNYTVVGDTVNTASRIDSLAKEFATTEDCFVLTSGDTSKYVNPADTALYDLTHLGEREIRGREGTVELFELNSKSD
jgi:adenylate cyclase